MISSGHRLVVCTPAGRRRYMEVLAAHVLRDPAVDEWRLWANTGDAADLAWMDALAAREPRVTVARGDWPLEGNYSIHHYFRDCVDPQTVYVRLDDDVVWAAPGAISRLAARRVADPEPFLYYGAVVNNAIASHLHQRAGLVGRQHGLVGYYCTDPVGWAEPAFAVELHRRFLARPAADVWKLQDWCFHYYERYSINAIAWAGADFAAFGGRVGRDEELWLSVEKPTACGRPTRVAGDCVFVHYAFGPQRAAVDGAPWVLAGYRELAGLPPV